MTRMKHLSIVDGAAVRPQSPRTSQRPTLRVVAAGARTGKARKARPEAAAR